MSVHAAARAAVCALAVAAAPAGAHLTEINVAAVEPSNDGAGFGDTGT